jgi:predicted alpha/beta-fold hydrolase
MTTFKPAWWLPGAHLQTVWPATLRRKQKLPLKRERVELPDGDFVDVDWMPQTAGAIILILHGLEGSVESGYASGMLGALSKYGWRCGVMHFRGCSGEVNRLPRTYHSGDTADVAFVIKKLREHEPNVPLAVIGFSLGGNVLLKWLGETAEQNPLAAAIAISVPFELDKAVDYLQQGFSKIYDKQLADSLVKKMRWKFATQTPPFPLPPNSEVLTIRQFDDKVTAPMYGFKSAQAYYEYASCRQYLKTITVPTLIVNAADDPFVPRDAIPQPHELAPLVQLEITQFGGHVGFVSGNIPGQPQYWLEQRLPEFLQKYL